MFPIKYQNGNYSVEVLSDGTKIRTGENFKPDFPESIDIKITNYCDLNKICTYCHEQSDKKGLHANFENLKKLIETCPSGMEFAIGGGNPLSHPNLIEFLKLLQDKEIIANLTVNQLHLKKFSNILDRLIGEKLIQGLGISLRTWSTPLPSKGFDSYPNTVWHLIAGIDTIESIETIPKNSQGLRKILILGYKNYGNGKIHLDLFQNQISKSLHNWQMYLPKLFKEDLILSFDNLAIEQLKLKRFFSDTEWEKFYMGDDGNFTCYVDMVNIEFAKSSTSEKQKITHMNIFKIFNNLISKR